MFSLLFTIFDSHWQKQRDVSERNLNQNLTSLNIFPSQQRHLWGEKWEILYVKVIVRSKEVGLIGK